MADDKKYFYMRLKDNFFDTEEITLLESLPDGYLYSNILLKLYLRSLKYEGRLMFNNTIPYNAQMIATITRHQIGTVEKALRIYEEMGFIEVLDNGAIYMLGIQELIGKSSSEADRKKEYRARIENEKESLKIEEKTSVRTNVPTDVGRTSTRDRDILNINNIREEGEGKSDPPPSPPIEPLQTAYQTDLDEIISTWNAQNCTHKIDRIPFGGRRYSNTMICINNNLPNFLLTIKDLDNQAWFADRAKRNDPLKYDWFVDPNNYIKVTEGNYRDLRQAEHKETDQERALRMIEEATE